jgi:hypothetical protein
MESSMKGKWLDDSNSRLSPSDEANSPSEFWHRPDLLRQKTGERDE